MYVPFHSKECSLNGFSVYKLHEHTCSAQQIWIMFEGVHASVFHLWVWISSSAYFGCDGLILVVFVLNCVC